MDNPHRKRPYTRALFGCLCLLCCLVGCGDGEAPLPLPPQDPYIEEPTPEEAPSAPSAPIVTSDKTTMTDSLPYKRIYHDTDTLTRGQEVVQVKGEDGFYTYEIETFYADGVATHEVRTDLERKEPTDEVILRGTRPPTVATGSFIYPVKNIVTSYYGWRTLNGKSDFHYGIDLRAAVGTAIAASDGGKVAFAGELGGINASYGKLIIIDHENGFRSYYAHLSSFSVKAGDRVYQGQIIGKSGVTGNVTGPHLHFEIRKDGLTQNPLNYLK